MRGKIRSLAARLDDAMRPGDVEFQQLLAAIRHAEPGTAPPVFDEIHPATGAMLRSYVGAIIEMELAYVGEDDPRFAELLALQARIPPTWCPEVVAVAAAVFAVLGEP